MNWMNVGEDQATNRVRLNLFVGLPGMAMLVLGGAMLYAGLSGAAKLLGF